VVQNVIGWKGFAIRWRGEEKAAIKIGIGVRRSPAKKVM